jgi:hypothetical protein
LGWPSRHTCGCHGGAHDRRSHRRRPSVADFRLPRLRTTWRWVGRFATQCRFRQSAWRGRRRSGVRIGREAASRLTLFPAAEIRAHLGDRWGTSKPALLTLRWLQGTKNPASACSSTRLNGTA